VAEALAAQLDTILAEIDATQGQPQDIGGYYQPERAKASAAMFPSQTFRDCLGV
jgi:isocitrate dehydrogenase